MLGRPYLIANLDSQLGKDPGWCVSTQQARFEIAGRRTPTYNPGASLIAQLTENPPAMQETPVQFLSWDYPLEKE